MPMINFTVAKDDLTLNCYVLSVIPNVGYSAIYLDENNNVVCSHFPFWLFVQTDDNKYFIPGLPFIIENPELSFERYLGYALTEDCVNIPNVKCYDFNPFVPEMLVNNVKQMLGI